MKRLIHLIPGLALFFAPPTPASATETIEAPSLGQYFKAEGVPTSSATFVLYDLSTDRLTVYNLEQSKRPLTPASTFKIPNSLIALETGAVKSIDEVFPYDGKPRWLPQWNKAMDLREAMKLSCVPVYQEVARRIGPERMKTWIERFNYGNNDVSGPIDEFWLGSTLKISAVEQTAFLAKLVTGKLPVSEKTLADVKELVLLEKTADYTLYGKTGWQPPVGWWVGWIVKGDRIMTFALNMELKEMKDAPKRLSIAKACMKQLGIL